MEKLVIEWKQEGNKLFFEFKDTEIYFIMPDDFKLEDTHPDLLKLSEWLMFSPWYDVLGDYKFSRIGGGDIGLSFSTGVDSTACMIALPDDTHLVYVQRDGFTDTLMKQDNALHFIKYLEEKEKRKVHVIKTNFEMIRTNFKLMPGYSTGMGMGVPTVLLADYLNLGIISFGKVLDDQFFPSGVFRDYPKGDYVFREELLNSCGLHGIHPFVGASEVITTQVVDNSPYKYLAYSCIRGTLGKQCNNCYKCYRKNLLRGLPTNLTPLINSFFDYEPLKMATSLLYGFNQYNVLPEKLSFLKGIDVSVLNKIYPRAYRFNDSFDQEWIFNKLKELGFELMNEEECDYLESLDFRRKNG